MIMKSVLLLFFLSLYSITTAQKTNDYLVYLDTLGNLGNDSNFKYIRVVEDYHLTKERYTIKEYYKSGKIAFMGTTRIKYPLFLDGVCVSYYENGNKKLVTNYVNSNLNGKQYAWYENGNLKYEKEFTYDKVSKRSTEIIINYIDENNVKKVIDGNGEYKEQEEETYIAIGEIKDGYKEGVWNGKHTKLNIKYVETYRKGKFISGESFDENNISHKYSEIETPAKPVGDMIAFSDYIKRNFYLGRDSTAKTLKGRIFVEFVVNKNGEIVEPKVIRDLGFGTGTEILRLLKYAKKWNPARLRGIPTDSKYTLPVAIDIISEKIEIGISHPKY